MTATLTAPAVTIPGLDPRQVAAWLETPALTIALYAADLPAPGAFLSPADVLDLAAVGIARLGLGELMRLASCDAGITGRLAAKLSANQWVPEPVSLTPELADRSTLWPDEVRYGHAYRLAATVRAGVR